MKDNEKIIVVFYLGTLGIGVSDLPRLLSETCDYYANQFDETVKPFFVPVRDTSYTRIEVLNPRYVSKNEYKKTVKEIKKTCKQARDTYKKEKNFDLFKLKF